MNKFITVILISVLTVNNAKSQITKYNWLVGGSGRYTSQIENLSGEKISIRSLEAASNIGYFFVDKLAGGIILSLQYYTTKRPAFGITDHSTNLGVGPFLRYYFLPVNNRINILVQSAYKYSTIKSSGASNTQNDVTFSAGPVLFFNESVGIELTGNYELYDQSKTSTTAKTFYISIGFQIHLESRNH